MRAAAAAASLPYLVLNGARPGSTTGEALAVACDRLRALTGARAAAHAGASTGSFRCSGARSLRPRNSCALAATTIVDRLIATAPILIGKTMPHGANRPA